MVQRFEAQKSWIQTHNMAIYVLNTLEKETNSEFSFHSC